MRVSKIALAAMSAASWAMILPSAASAQQPAGAPPSARPLTLTSEERAALVALQASASGTDRAAQDSALAAARAVARGADARYALAHYQLQIGRARQDGPLTAQAVDALVSSGLATSEEMPSLLVNQATRAFFEGEHARAERLLARAVELQPNDPALIAEYAQLKSMIGSALVRGGRRPEANTAFQESVALLQRAIDLQQAANQPVPESWYKRAVALSFDHGLRPQSVALARGMVSRYPDPLNWRDALHVYRLSVPADPALDLDLRRLARATQALGGEPEYIQFAEALGRANLHGEAKAVLDEGLERGMLEASKPIVRQITTANSRRVTTERSGLDRARTQALAGTSGAAALAAGDSHFGFGRYGEAVELYQAALQKGGEDANLVNTRLGAALALAGRRAEAEAAFRAVTGPRADLAAFWLAWLAGRPA